MLENKYYAPDVDAFILLTEWSEFRNIDWEQMRQKFPSCKYVFDGRNIYDRKAVENAGFKYFGIGK